MLDSGSLTTTLVFAGSALSAALPDAGFDINSSFEPALRNYVPDHIVLRLQQRNSSNCGSSSYYNPSVGIGACGWQNSDSELVVALPSQYFQGKCGQSITVTANGKTATARIVDLCPGCAGGHVDMSPALFQQFADLGQGRVNTCWTYSSAASAPAASTTSAPVAQPVKKAESDSYSFPPDFEPAPKEGLGAVVPAPAPTTSQMPSPLPATSTPPPPPPSWTSTPAALPTTLHTTITRTSTSTVPFKTATKTKPSKTGAEMYQAAVGTYRPVPANNVTDGLFAAIQDMHKHGWKNGVHSNRTAQHRGNVTATGGRKPWWLEWAKLLQFNKPVY